ncbi:MAG: DNA (cytosine-5-)-methyltransferase [Thermomicrobiales bacterium]|nr:DNA (cytosine-5-)-methyltransferase [Thermomicrobiales bacterium]
MHPDRIVEGFQVSELTNENYQEYFQLLRSKDQFEVLPHSIENGSVVGPTPTQFTFIDLFAGIGGIRLAFEKAGGQCVFTSEWNPWARKTYEANFGIEDTFFGDIVAISDADIPDHDVLLAGFPCQPFSIAGVSKKNALGVPHGFECTTQGTLFFEIQRIIAAKQPKAFLLENVKNLLSHDGGNTFRVIRHVLKEELGYNLFVDVLDAKPFVPQHRERIIIIGFKDHEVNFDFGAMNLPSQSPTLTTVLHSEDGSEAEERPYTLGAQAKVNPKYVLSDRLWSYLQAYAEKHKAAGNGFGYGLVTKDDTTRTLSARYYKDGSEILVSRGSRRNPRRLTPRECARLMGFPKDFVIPVSDTQAYKQFGNSVVVPLMDEVARVMVSQMLGLESVSNRAANDVVSFVRVQECLTL